MQTKSLALIFCFLILLAGCSAARAAESAYSKLDFEKGCEWGKPGSEEEAQMGGEAICKGYGNYTVFFGEFDLRQYTAYGNVDDPLEFANGFAQWNSVHDVIEWRLENKLPFATIHRWFVENINQDTGSAEAATRGQVLVVSTVADAQAPSSKRISCAAGYVDALANKNANELARKVADEIARGFVCGRDRPVFHGTRGKLSGDPYDLGQ